MLISSGSPHNLWGEALLTVNQGTPQETCLISFELWYERPPSYHYLKMWGYLAKVLAPLPKKTKLGAKTMDCIFIGYVLNSSAYRFLVYKLEISDIHVNMIIESRYAMFFEDIFSCKR